MARRSPGHIRTLFGGGAVFDGHGGAAALADVVVEGGRIADVGRCLDGDELIDCTGCTVMPGMFDCHVHTTIDGIDRLAFVEAPFSLQFYVAAQNLRTTLATGITTVRDAGGADLGIRAAQERGLIAGPRLRLAINILSQTGGHNDGWHASGCALALFPSHPGRPDCVVDGPAEARRKVRELIRAGADVIKVATSGGVLTPRGGLQHAHFRDDEIRTMVDEAAAAGLYVMAHAGATEGIKAAVRNGARSIEHGDWLDEEAVEMMLDHGTWLVPTLLAGRSLVAAAEAGAAVGDRVAERARAVVAAQADSVRRAIAAGVRIAMGTDSGVVPHGRNLDELALMVELGMRPEQALHAATLSAATLMGLDGELGSLEAEKRADLVLVDGDVRDLTSFGTRVRRVYQDGHLMHDVGLPAR